MDENQILEKFSAVSEEELQKIDGGVIAPVPRIITWLISLF
jgi:bacteriocin-like protein